MFCLWKDPKIYLLYPYYSIVYTIISWYWFECKYFCLNFFLKCWERLIKKWISFIITFYTLALSSSYKMILQFDTNDVSPYLFVLYAKYICYAWPFSTFFQVWNLINVRWRINVRSSAILPLYHALVILTEIAFTCFALKQ